MERDVSGVAVERAAFLLARVRARIREKVPYGPDKVRMSPEEFRRAVARMSPQQFITTAQEIGVDKALAALTGVRREEKASNDRA